MAAARQGLPVRLDRAPQRGAAFAITRASRRARRRSVGSRSRTMGSLLIFDHPPSPPPSPGPAHYLVARDHRLPALRHVHLLMNVLHSDVLVSARSLALKREQALLTGFAVLRLIASSNLVGCHTGRSAGLAPFRILPV